MSFRVLIIPFFIRWLLRCKFTRKQQNKYPTKFIIYGNYVIRQFFFSSVNCFISDQFMDMLIKAIKENQLFEIFVFELLSYLMNDKDLKKYQNYFAVFIYDHFYTVHI